MLVAVAHVLDFAAVRMPAAAFLEPARPHWLPDLVDLGQDIFRDRLLTRRRAGF